MIDDIPVVCDKTVEMLNETFKKLSPMFEEWAISQGNFPFNLKIDLTTDDSSGCIRYSQEQTDIYYWAFHAGYIRAENR
jgi:hypothetical protein